MWRVSSRSWGALEISEAKASSMDRYATKRAPELETFEIVLHQASTVCRNQLRAPLSRPRAKSCPTCTTAPPPPPQSSAFSWENRALYVDVCVTCIMCVICVVTHCNTLQHAATHCNTLQHTHTHSPMTCVTCVICIATHCNTLQHTATHCNTLQHSATHPCK